MKDINIIDNFMDDREFRNYIGSFLQKQGFTDIEIEDARISDEDEINNNDMFARKGNVRYTIQTFLNEKIDKHEIKETLDDMDVERVSRAILVTNTEVDDEVKEDAKAKGIEIWDKNYLIKYMD